MASLAAAANPLLLLLQNRCRELGITMKFEYEFDPVQLDEAPFADSDLIVAADGSTAASAPALPTILAPRSMSEKTSSVGLVPPANLTPLNIFSGPPITVQWSPTAINTKLMPAPGSYETTKAAWLGLGFDKLDDSKAEHLPLLEQIFARELEGHKLIDNRSMWRHFPMIRNATAVRGNVVLMGDAKSTAHYSIGSGTKLAMEDAIGLFEAMCASASVTEALAGYESASPG